MTSAETASTNRPKGLSARVYDDLLGRLRRGLVKPDERLVDLEIAAQLGVSRMPVREALLQLVSEGYLVGTARGYRIPTLGRADITEIFEVRRLLEPRAAALAARDLTPTAQRQLDAALKRARSAVAGADFFGLFDANVAFRHAWLGAVANSRLAGTIARFADHVQQVRFGTLHDAATQRLVLDGMTELHDAFTRRDPVAAQDRMQRFIMAAERSFLAQAEREAGRSADE